MLEQKGLSLSCRPSQTLPSLGPRSTPCLPAEARASSGHGAQEPCPGLPLALTCSHFPPWASVSLFRSASQRLFWALPALTRQSRATQFQVSLISTFSPPSRGTELLPLLGVSTLDPPERVFRNHSSPDKRLTGPSHSLPTRWKVENQQ